MNVNFRPTESRMVPIISRTNMAKKLEEDNLMAWAGLNIGNAVVMLGNFYLEGALSHLNSFYVKDEQLKSVERWARSLNKNIDTLNTFLAAFYKSKKTQLNHVAGLIDIFQDVIERMVKVTADCETLSDARLNTEVIIAPSDQHRNLKKQKGVVFYSEIIKQMINNQTEEMEKEGLKPNEDHGVLDQMKAEAANEAQNIKLRALRKSILEVKEGTKIKTKKAAFDEVITMIDGLL